MSKRKDRIRKQTLFATVVAQTTTCPDRPYTERTAVENQDEDDEEAKSPHAHDHAPVSEAILSSSTDFARLTWRQSGVRPPLTKLKKFRFQLLREWITEHTAPCRVADIGGGKGLLAYLLIQSGWEATTIDPFAQSLPTKYKDFVADRQVRIAESESVPRRNLPFAPEMAQEFDLLVAMHAHGCNIQIIDAAKSYRKDVILLPCCIIDEPLRPDQGVHWLQCLADYAKSKGFIIEPFRLNFEGQNIGLYARHSDSSS
jgi:hypothetical protein